MNRLQRDAIVAMTIEELGKQGSWSGETHVQKAIYFLQEMLDVSTGFEFVLYKHGPFSFNLRDELMAMRADRFIAIKPQAPPYGPSFVPDSGAAFLKQRFPRTLARHRAKVEFVARSFGGKDVAQLERLATSLYVSRRRGAELSPESQADLVNRLKPHISLTQAKAAVEVVARWREEADKLLN